MVCYYPLSGYRSPDKGKTGKSLIVFNPAKGYVDKKLELPCGRCIGCRLERSRQWAIRCMHEASLHEQNCYITLTYNDTNLTPNGNLLKGDFQKFMKRLRKEISPIKIRYYECGEYGEKFSRPHFHACIFGYEFKDLTSHYNNGKIIWSSKLLSEVWNKGYNSVDKVTFESAAYVARYILKKINGKESDEHYVNKENGELREKEFTTMSRRPGIGKGWFDKYCKEVYNTDSVIINGKEVKPPKYYDSQYELIDKGAISKIKYQRVKAVDKEENSSERLRVREKFLEARLKTKIRDYEKNKE